MPGDLAGQCNGFRVSCGVFRRVNTPHPETGLERSGRQGLSRSDLKLHLFVWAAPNGRDVELVTFDRDAGRLDAVRKVALGHGLKEGLKKFGSLR